VYPRLGPTSEWDTAAAQCVVESAGGRVTDLDGQPLRYNKPNILNPWFLVTAGMGTTGTRCSAMAAEPTRPLYLALDQGGHASRALVFDAHGVAQARRPA